MLENEIKIVITQNKFGYLGADLYVKEKRVGLTNILTMFELTWLNNRRSNLKLDIVEKEYRGQFYNIVVIRDTNGYDDEYITLRLDQLVRDLIVDIVSSDKIG